MKLSYSQFETINALFGRVDRALNTFDAYHVFDQRNNEDNGHRRTLNSLAKTGLLERMGNTSTYRIPSWRALLDADQEYRRKYNVWD